ncbi:hypothetical protein [Jatrophihabitans sp.]|uniref:hypothetical protein n=1 Tax=Jatrophihabitans sp. TaxID=1932789 RepID=UPI0030C70455|nr:hypothetical protein [Jatrophihabitans sp.]
MTTALPHLSTTSWVLIIVGGLILLSLITGFLGRALLRRGLREPFVVKLINRASERVVVVIKRPITIAVLDEVAAVLYTGNYTRNIAASLSENREEIKAMFAEKIKQDPSSRGLGLLPFHDRLVDEITETALRVVLEVLADPRTDDLVSDIVRDNVDQIRRAVRERDVPAG